MVPAQYKSFEFPNALLNIKKTDSVSWVLKKDEYSSVAEVFISVKSTQYKIAEIPWDAYSTPDLRRPDLHEWLVDKTEMTGDQIDSIIKVAKLIDDVVSFLRQ